MNIWVYDTEVFQYDWLFVAKEVNGDRTVMFWNDNYSLVAFLDSEKPILAGYNTKGYDQWVVKAMYYGGSPAVIKALNDYIIADHKDGWTFPFLQRTRNRFTNVDLMDDIPVFLRLKEIEGNLRMSVEESSVPFDIDRPLTDEELVEVIKYCYHDVEATERLLWARKDYLESKIAVGAMKGIEPGECLHMTNGKLAAKYLDAKETPHNDERNYTFPENIKYDRIPAELLDFFSRLYDDSLSNDEVFKGKTNIEIGGIPWTYGFGGTHAGIECYTETSSPGRKIICQDFSSLYPNIMINFGYTSRAIPDTDGYKAVVQRRLKAKAAGDKKTADALKLIINSAYGIMLNRYNNMYDPLMGRSVCITGQLILTDLAVGLLRACSSIKLINVNTDGLIFSIDEGEIETAMSTAAELEQRVGISLERTDVQKIVQRDVNTYIMRDSKGYVHGYDSEDVKIKYKGGYVSNYGGGDYANASLVGVAQAIVKFLLDGVPIEKTIREITDPFLFQMIAKCGSSYDHCVQRMTDGREVLVQNVNRVYATKNQRFGTLYKVKTNVEYKATKTKPSRIADKYDKIQNLPAHCIIDNPGTITLDQIDIDWYVALAESRANDFLSAPTK